MIDVTHQINAVTRTVGSKTMEAGEARVITISQTYATDVEDLWDACTNPDRIPRWFLPVSGDLKEGGRYQLEGNAGGTIESCDKPTSFKATWEYGGDISWIEVTFSPTETGARFQLEHIAHVDDERWAEFGPGAVGIGWEMALLGLTLHLSTSEPVDPAEFAAWVATKEGRDFMTQSGESWYKANIAAGTDKTIARESADRCIAAYTATE